MNLLFGTGLLWPPLALVSLWMLYWLVCMQIHSRERT